MLVLCLGTMAYAAETSAPGEVSIKLIADNKVIDTPTHVVNSRTLVPLRALLESTNATVEWDNPTRTATVNRNGVIVKVQIDNPVMSTPAGDVALDAAPVLLNEGTTTYVPLRAICEAFNFTVDWDNTGSNTILILSPDGCPYFDIYEGATLENYFQDTNEDKDAFETKTGLKYEEHKNKLFVHVDNLIPVNKVAEMNGLELTEMFELFGTAEVNPETPWGEYKGNLTMKQYIENFTPALQYGMSAEQALENMKAAYELGNEYTLDTPYKYVRVIIDKSDFEYQKELEADQEAMAKAEAEQKAADLAELPKLLENKVYFTITLQDGRKMEGELYPDLAPATVENFIKLCNENFYEGLIFHRVIDGFMIQGGGYDKDFNLKDSGMSIIGEFYANGISNALAHDKGVLSMARTSEPNSASSQFFIMDEKSPHLDGQYAAFGKITKGLEVVEAISQVETTTNEQGHSDVPVKPIIIKSIKIKK